MGTSSDSSEASSGSKKAGLSVFNSVRSQKAGAGVFCSLPCPRDLYLLQLPRRMRPQAASELAFD